MAIVSSRSEISSLHGEGEEKEEVRLEPLDSIWRTLGEPEIDFVKLDAEGEEENILKGGERFFTEGSPLVMFEIKSDSCHSTALLTAFEALGYQSYRLIPGLGLLVPVSGDAGFDPFQINLFACKPARAAQLAARNLLVMDAAGAPPSRPAVLPVLTGRPFAAGLASSWNEPLPGSALETALACCLASEESTRPAAERWALLLRSLTAFNEAIGTEDHPATRLGLLRVLRNAGERSAALHTLHPLCTAGPDPASLAQACRERPFLPPLPWWDTVPVHTTDEAWFAAMIADTAASSLHYSTADSSSVTNAAI